MLGCFKSYLWKQHKYPYVAWVQTASQVLKLALQVWGFHLWKLKPGAWTKKPAFFTSTRSFGGFASPEKYAEEADTLAKTLRNRGQPFHEDFFYTAGYDSPFKLFNRHNEVWYFKK